MSLKEFSTAAEITTFPIDLRVSLGDLPVSNVGISNGRDIGPGIWTHRVTSDALTVL